MRRGRIERRIERRSPSRAWLPSERTTSRSRATRERKGERGTYARATPREPCGISSASNRELSTLASPRSPTPRRGAAVISRVRAASFLEARAERRKRARDWRSSADSQRGFQATCRARRISGRIRNDRARSLDRSPAVENLNFGFDGRRMERRRGRGSSRRLEIAHAGYTSSLAKCRVCFAVNGSRHLLTSTTLCKCDEPARRAIKSAARRLR